MSVCAGYCSLVQFSDGDLGTPLAADKVPAHIQPLMAAAAKAATPATPEQLAPTKAPRKGQPQQSPCTAPTHNQAIGAQCISALQALPGSSQQPRQAPASTGPAERPEACQQHPANQENTGSQPAQIDLIAAEDARPSQAAAALPEPAQPAQPSAQKRLMTEALLGQPAQAGTAQAGSAVKKQKRIAPTAMASAFSAPSTARSGKPGLVDTPCQASDNV